MLSNLRFIVNRKDFWKQYHQEIILFTAIILISLLSFAAGFIAAKLQEREPLQIIPPTAEESMTVQPS